MFFLRLKVNETLKRAQPDRFTQYSSSGLMSFELKEASVCKKESVERLIGAQHWVASSVLYFFGMSVAAVKILFKSWVVISRESASSISLMTRWAFFSAIRK